MPHPADDIVAALYAPSKADGDEIRRAYDFSEKAHGEEKRKSGEPYIVHPHAIAVTLAKLGMDRETVIAGILHDTIEDTTVTADEIEKEFGKTVRFLVEGVTKTSKLKYRGLERHVESLRRLLVATASDIRVIIIKLADRLHNMHTIEHVEPAEKRERIARETLEVHVPIAERLGMGTLKSELEDLSFAVLDPKGYEGAMKTITEETANKLGKLDDAVNDLRRNIAEAGLRAFRTETRVKSAYSFARKLEEKDGNIDRIYDLLALRIIVPSIEDCYRTMGIVHKLWRPIPGRVKDYIAFPKPNGYRSLHTSVITGNGVTVEVQIRTEEMHRDSQLGVASHFNYKLQAQPQVPRTSIDWLRSLLPRGIRQPAHKGTDVAPTPRWLKDLTEIQAEIPEHEAFRETLARDFFAERMFIFTPKGDVIDLPIGATAVDFAYAVHSDLGDRMTGAKANGKIIALDAPLHNGMIVEVLTKKSGTPNKKWLDFAKTSGARKHIRAALQNKQHTP